MWVDGFIAEAAQKLIWTEWLMVAVFLVGVVSWGCYLRGTAQSLEGSFLAGRRVPGFLASLSTVATNLNVNDFIGGAGLAYGFGVVLTHGSWVNGLGLVFVSLFLVQKLRRLNVFTLGGWLEKRYCFAIGLAYSAVWSLVWMLFNLGLYIYGGALVLNTLVGWNLYWCIVVLSIIAAVYTLIGGFGAVVATDVLLICLMFFPFLFLAGSVWADIGGAARLASVLPREKAVFWASDTEFGPLSMMLAGMFFMGMSYWGCEAQVIQRPLSARSEEDSIISYLGATFWLSILLPFLVFVPALAAIHYFPDLPNRDLAMPSLIAKFLPRGLYGVTVVGLMAGMLSSVDAQINSFCTMFTTDIYKRVLRPGRTETHYLRASHVAGVIFTLAAIGTAYLFSKAEGGMMLFAISILATIMPPFAGITLVGALVRRANRMGAIVGLTCGGATAIGLIIMSNLGWLSSVARETLYFRTMVTFFISAGLTYVVSRFTAYAPLPDNGAPEVDISVNISPRVLRLTVVLLIGMAAVAGFWSYYFR